MTIFFLRNFSLNSIAYIYLLVKFLFCLFFCLSCLFATSYGEYTTSAHHCRMKAFLYASFLADGLLQVCVAHIMLWATQLWWLDWAFLIDDVISYLVPLLVNVLKATRQAQTQFRGAVPCPDAAIRDEPFCDFNRFQNYSFCELSIWLVLACKIYTVTHSEVTEETYRNIL